MVRSASLICVASVCFGACTPGDTTRRLARPQSPPVAFPPHCSVLAAHRTKISGDAGCIIQMGQRLVVVKHARSGKLTVPGGSAKGSESAQCTAHRETWEEAGVNVEVGPLLATLDNGFHLFSCRVRNGERARWSALLADGSACQRPREVAEVMLVDAAQLTRENYRFPRYLEDVKLVLGP